MENLKHKEGLEALSKSPADRQFPSYSDTAVLLLTWDDCPDEPYFGAEGDVKRVLQNSGNQAEHGQQATVSTAPAARTMETDPDEKSFHCTFDTCRRAFKAYTSFNDLKRHLHTVHGVDLGNTQGYTCKAHGCRQPDKVWPRLDNFKQHLLRMHKGLGRQAVGVLPGEVDEQARSGSNTVDLTRRGTTHLCGDYGIETITTIWHRAIRRHCFDLHESRRPLLPEGPCNNALEPMPDGTAHVINANVCETTLAPMTDGTATWSRGCAPQTCCTVLAA